MKNNSIKTIVATGIGAALFVIIGMFIHIPLFANTSVQLQYAIQALLAVIFGPIPGFLIGLIGHAIKDMLTYGIWWTWVIPSGLVGLGFGYLGKFLRVEQGVFEAKDILFFNFGQLVINGLAWGLIAPVGDILVYSEPAAKTFTQAGISSVANALTVALGGTILLAVYANSRTKDGSLKKD